MIYYAAFEGHKACSEHNKDKDNKDENNEQVQSDDYSHGNLHP